MDQIYIFILHFSFAALTFSQSTDDEKFTGCHQLYTHNYGYKIYYPIPKDAMLSETKIWLNFSVQAASDAHVLFSPSFNPKDSDPSYEIVIGAGWNTFAAIRRLNQAAFGYQNRTSNLLSRQEMRSFWIKIDNGLITVGVEGSAAYLIQHRDPRPLKVNYVSFSSWHGVNAKWYWDCNDPAPLIPIVAVNKTSSQKLRDDLFYQYDPFIPPASDDDSFTINSNLNINYIQLDTKSSTMDVRGMLNMEWVDFKLQWSPTDYDGIEIIRLTERKIWQPEFLLYNGASQNQKWFDDGILMVNYQGEVIWKTSVHFITRCNINIENWPNDLHLCSIQLGMLNNHPNVHLGGLKNITWENDAVSIWEMVDVQSDGVFMISPWDAALPDNDDTNDNEIPFVVTINMKLKRYTSSHYYLYNIPVKVTTLMSVISFCLPYDFSPRIILQGITLIMFIINLISTFSALPPVIKSTPNILSLNSGLLSTSIIGTILTVLLKELSKRAFKISFKNNPILDKLVNLTVHCNKYSNIMGEKILTNLEDEDEEAESNRGSTAVEQQKIPVKNTSEAFLQILDYLLLFAVVITYVTFFILF